MIRVHETFIDPQTKIETKAAFNLNSWDMFESYVRTMTAVPYWEANKRFLHTSFRKHSPNRVEYRSIHDANGLVVSLDAELADKHGPCTFCACYRNDI